MKRCYLFPLHFIYLFSIAVAAATHHPPPLVHLEGVPSYTPVPHSALKSSPPSSFELDLKILVLSATKDPAIEPSMSLGLKALANLGIPFDHVVLTDSGNRISDTPLDLTNPDGSGKYYGIVLSTGQLIYTDSEGKYQSALTTSQWEQLQNYEQLFSVRRVSLYTFPTPSLGVKVNVETDRSQPYTLFLGEASKKYASGLVETMDIPTHYSWSYPSDILQPEVATPFMYFKEKQGSSVASIISRFSDQREQLHFFFSQSPYVKCSLIISPIWIHWLTKGLYTGKRRLFLNIEVDDIFLSTDLWDPLTSKPTENATRIYRLNPDDLELFTRFLKGPSSAEAPNLRTLTKNDQFRIELAFNGQGMFMAGGLREDPLFRKTRELITDYFWLNHSFSHADFDWQNYSWIDWELKANLEVASDLFQGNLKTNPWFSRFSMVTPKISGLMNPHALKALYDNEIFTVVGDNTHSEFLPPHPHIGLYTTLSFNNFDGILIVPRYSTVIYYNVSTPEENASEYNFLYTNFFGRSSTFTEVLEREVERVSWYLFSFEYAPYMFHQANLRSFPWESGRESLLSLWIKSVIKEIRKYNSLPILNKKLDQLAQEYKERMSVEKCEAGGKLFIKGNQFTGIQFRSQRDCNLPLTGPHFKPLAGVTTESYGPDFTTFVPLKKDKKIMMELESPLLW